MYSQDELVGLYGFLKNTGEGNLRKMMVAGKMTDAHLRILLKIVRSSKENEFAEFVQNGSFPKMKFNAGELALKETFWTCCIEAFTTLGLLTKAKAA